MSRQGTAAAADVTVRRFGRAAHYDERPMLALSSSAVVVMRHLIEREGGEDLVAVTPGLHDRHPSDREDIVAELEMHGLVEAERLDPYDVRVLPGGPSMAPRTWSLERCGLARRGNGSETAPWLLKLTAKARDVRLRALSHGNVVRRSRGL